MKLIKSKVEIIQENDPYKMIEIAGRTCYKSEENTTEDSAKEFVNRMIKSGHGAMLEHGTVYLTFFQNASRNININCTKISRYLSDDYFENKFSKINYKSTVEGIYYYVTTNLRVLVENWWLEDLKYLCEPTKYHEKRVTVRFTCDRGVSHEFVRHRVFSFAQESQRYCNYSKDKYNSEITIVKPHWWTKEDDINATLYLNVWRAAEYSYNTLIENGIKPQDARSVLPNATKTELVMTGFESDWEGFFKLRCSKAAHPDAKKLADELYKLIHK